MSPLPRTTRLWLFGLFTVLLLVSCKKELDMDKQETSQEVLSELVNPLGNYWTTLNNPSIPSSGQDRNLTFSLNNKVYSVPIGWNQLWEYDPATGQWTKKQNSFFPDNVANYDRIVAFSTGNSVYIINPDNKQLKEYNITTFQWTDKASFPGSAKTYAALANTTTNGYVMGGKNGHHANGTDVTINENWEYNFAIDTWTQKASTPGFGRMNAAAHAVGDLIYFGLGITTKLQVLPNLSINWVTVMNSDWWEYNTLTNSWTQRAAFGGGTRQDTRGFVIGSKVYVGLGSAGYFTDKKSDLWSYSPSTNSWTQRAGFPGGNDYPPFISMVACGSRGYAVRESIDFFYRYTPQQVIFPPNGSVAQ